MTGWIVTFDPNLRVDTALSSDADDRIIALFLSPLDAKHWVFERNYLGASIVEVTIHPKAEPRPPAQARYQPFVM